MTATVSPSGQAPPRHIPVNGQPIKGRFAQQKIHTVVYGALLGFVAAGLYFGIWEVNWYIHIGAWHQPLFYNKSWWDGTLGTWLSHHVWFISQQNYSAYRHAVGRNFLEAAFAGVGVMTLAAPAKYWTARTGAVQTVARCVLFAVAYIVLACGGTWLILFGQARFSPHGVSHGLWTLTQYVVLGAALSQVLHRIIGPVGARVQGVMVERGVDNHLRHDRPGVPWWVRFPVVAPTIRERGQQLISDDRASGEAAALAQEGPSARHAIAYWLAGLALLVLPGIAFTGFVGHIWVGVLGHSFPYLAP